MEVIKMLEVMFVAFARKNPFLCLLPSNEIKVFSSALPWFSFRIVLSVFLIIFLFLGNEKKIGCCFVEEEKKSFFPDEKKN